MGAQGAEQLADAVNVCRLAGERVAEHDLVDKHRVGERSGVVAARAATLSRTGS